ncbi:unnamed protein product [Rangifer tarandus platyrhynchus]|uniref:Uncharacterized protein n=1 Tax=Rangifer tarandus platyrhynchus TaxID=3082113 RepID=A0AC60AAS2_RANTA
MRQLAKGSERGEVLSLVSRFAPRAIFAHRPVLGTKLLICRRPPGGHGGSARESLQLAAGSPGALDEAAALCPANTQELSDSADFTRQGTGPSSEKTTYRLGTPTACARPRQLADPHKRHGQAGTLLPTSQIRRQRSRSFVAFPRLHQNLRPSLISCRGLPAPVAET